MVKIRDKTIENIKIWQDKYKETQEDTINNTDIY